MVDGTSRGVRKPRKSRGRGLRATTGCLTCKRRHVKCDEVHPQCGPCAKGQRACAYGTSSNSPTISNSGHDEGSSIVSQDLTASQTNTAGKQPQVSPQVLADACQDPKPDQHESPMIHGTPYTPSQNSQNHQNLDPVLGNIQASCIKSPEFIPSPATDSSSIRGAPLSWFELLANDAVNADRNLPLSSPQAEPFEVPLRTQNFLPRNVRERESYQAAAFEHDPELEKRLVSTLTDNQPESLPDVRLAWSSDTPIDLSDKEKQMLKHFVLTLGHWLDFFDPSRHFSILVPHLALKNIGVMKALLALTARHVSIWSENQHRYSNDRVSGRSPSRIGGLKNLRGIDRNAAVQYYFETLHYLSKAMQYHSYTCSDEIIATALLISTYEMIDGSNSDWERHLKGVFWIQRYQNNDGECGGMRQAVWWAWLRQDAWVAMREKRRVFSFWKPKKHVSTLTAAELACYSHYLLAQCINYVSREESRTTDIRNRLERGNELLFMLQEWYDCLPREFTPLVTADEPEVYPSIWVNPPSYAAALQIHSLARVLVILHRPSTGADEDLQAAQKLLTSSLNVICGIARAIHEDDLGASLIALECLFGAGMAAHTPNERAALLDLVESLQRRVRWPMSSLREELEREYRKGGLSYSLE